MVRRKLLYAAGDILAAACMRQADTQCSRTPQSHPATLPTSLPQVRSMKPTIPIVTRGSNGELRSKDYAKHETVLKMHTQIGVDDCSTDLSLRGMPVFRGLIGPMPEAKGVVRYETPEVFETLTKEWSVATATRSRRRRVDAAEV
jgi:hypothetical protein